MLKTTARIFLVLLLIIAAMAAYYFGYPFSKAEHIAYYKSGNERIELERLNGYAAKARDFCKKKNYNTQTCFLIDMSLPSGKNRFFVYDLQHDSILNAGLVAHGSCNYNFLREPKFSNTPGCGCTAEGKYKVGYKYKGRFGNAFKLYGLDSSNSNAFKRNIVLHSYSMVPEKETWPMPICNSLGCAMVSNKYLTILEKQVDKSKKPIFLWIFE